jgi:predicted RNA polymerase sigma factor
MRSRNHQFNRIRRRIRRKRSTQSRKPWETDTEDASESSTDQNLPDSFLKILR